MFGGVEGGSQAQGARGVTWRFMGSYKWGYQSPNMDYRCGYPTYYNPTYKTTHEPPVSAGRIPRKESKDVGLKRL